MIKAVLWDFGGVFTTSPFEAFNRYEAQHGLPTDFIRQVNATNPDNNAWARLESDGIDLARFDLLFAEETAAAGHRIAGSEVIALLSGDIRPRMIAALRTIRQTYQVACITNNVRGAGKGAGMAAGGDKAAAIEEIMGLFDFVLESSKVGVRKPDPKIYTLACERLGLPPEEVVFLDDLGINLKPARAMGMQTIKVVSEAQALRDLESILNLALQ